MFSHNILLVFLKVIYLRNYFNILSLSDILMIDSCKYVFIFLFSLCIIINLMIK